MCLQDTVRIPLRARDGSIRAYAIVDANDAEWAMQYRWHVVNGYVSRSEYRGGGRKKSRIQRILMHRDLLGLVPFDGIEVDHRNRNRLDNRRSNLRTATRAEQVQNVSSRPGSSSQYRGVSWREDGQVWRAYIQVNGKNTYLGNFASEEEAAEVAREARLRLMPYAVD